MHEHIAALFLERDQINARIQDINNQISRRRGYFDQRPLLESRKKETRLLESLDVVLPMMLALDGRMSEVRALYPQAPFLLNRGTHDPGPVLGLRGPLGDRVDTLLKAVGPFPDVYFGLGRDGQMLIGLKPYPGGNLFMFGQQLRYPDLFIYFGPEADVRDLASMFRMDPFNLPASPFPTTERNLLLRIEGPDNPDYNPRFIAERIQGYVSAVVPNSVPDGFIQLHESTEQVVKAVAKPQIFTPNWWVDAVHPGDVDWGAALINIGGWRKP